MQRRAPHRQAPRRQPGECGFTLVELMVVVAVVAILATVAYPSYLDQVRKGRRADAVVALSQVQQAQERWRANQPSYTAALATAAPDGLGLPPASSHGYYTLAIEGASATGYTVTATATDGTSQASDTGCQTLSIAVTNGSGVHTPAACWSQ